MSKTVDERVVEMRFDNSQFEKNVSTTMSTLDKFKQKLNLSGASKGLENVSSAAKKVDMSGLGAGIEAVKVKFSALEVMGVTALANLTNSAVNAGKRMISALTIDPVMDGFREYETQMNAVQTILANTQKEGTNVQTVNKALDELNTYADKTIYNFTEMTRNIGTFTAAGVKLDTSVSSIKGIANLAAVSGSNSQQASTAMYQLSQAIAAGTVKLMDWNSVVNAGMGGQVFQEALIRTSEHLQTGAKAAIEAKGSFRESLQTGWLTTEVLTQTLDQFSTAADTQEEYEEAVKKFIEQGYTQEEAKQMADMAKTAGEAATKVKTFTQLIDTLKEALGSGWTKTWQLIIGDFEEAKELWTGVSDVLSGFINNMSDARNKLLESALGKGFSSLTEKISDIVGPAEKVIDTIGDTVDVLGKLDELADDVIYGSWGNGQERFDALTESGENYYRVQNKVNEKLGESFRYTDEQIDAQDELLGIQKKSSDELDEESKGTVQLTEEKKNLIKEIASMTEEQMRSKGYTDEQIEAFKELGETADKLGMPLNEFIDNMDQITGRWLLINSFKNIGKSIINVFTSIGKAWRSIFDPMSADTLFDIIAGFHKFTAVIKTFTEENADKLMRTFRGLFAALDIVRTIVGGGLKIAFKALSAILGAFDMNVLDLTAMIGDAIVALRKFLKENDLITKGFELLGRGVKMVVEAFKALYKTVSGLPRVQEFIQNIQNIDLSEIGKNIIAGLKNGLKDGITSIPQMLIEIGKKLLEAIKGVLGIHSPSTEMYDVGKYAIEGLVNGLKDGVGKVWDVISDIGSKMLEWLKGFNWNKAFAVVASAGLLLIVKKMVGVLDNITAPLKGVGELLSGVGSVLDGVGDVLEKSSKSIKKILDNTAKVIKGFAKILNAQAFKMKAAAIKDLAIGLLILAASVALLAQLDTAKLWSSVGAIAVLAVILVGLAVAMDKLTSASATIDKNGFNLKGLKTGLINIGVAIVLIAAAVKLMGSMDPDQAKQGFLGLAGVVVAIGVVFAAFGLLVKGKSAQNIDKAGVMIRKMAVTLLLMVAAVKLIGMLKPEELGKGAAFAAGFLVFVALLAAISMMADKKIDKLGSTMKKISVAMLLMVGVVKLAGTLSKNEMIKGAGFAAAFLIFIGVLVAITKVDKGQEFAKLGILLLSVSVAMLLMIGVVKLVGRLSKGEMLKGATFAAAFVLFIKALVAVTKIGSEEQIAKVAGTILAMSVAIGIMAGVCILLSLIDLGALAKGVVAVGILGAILALMIKATKGANDVKGSIIAMAVAIGVMAAAIVVLSFIDPKKLVGPVLAMTILMGMFALIEKAGSSITSSMGTLIAMTVAIGLMAGAIFLLSYIPIEKALGAAASLSVLMLSFSVAMKIISTTGTVAPMALVAIGVMTLIVGALAGILYLLRDMDPASSIATAVSLSTLLLSMSACCLILTAVGAAGPAALIGIASLGALIAGVGGIVIALGALSEHFPKMEEFLDKGIPILEKIGYALGSFFGNIIGGFAAGVTSGLPEIATNLSTFMINLQPFIDGAKQIDETALTGVKSLAEMMALISGASILESVASWITGSSSMDTFAMQLDKFADAIVSFSTKVKGNIDESSVLAAANAGKMMAEMASSIPGTGGVVQWFTGEKDMATFSIQLVAFGDAIVQFSNKVSEGINEEAVMAAANAGKIMAEMQKSIVPSGGVVQWFTGEKDMSTFGSQLKAFGEAIVGFSKKVSEGVSEEAITAAANAGKIMIEMQKSIVPSGGVVQWFTGEKNMATFGTQLVVFGDAIMQFSEKVSGGINEEAVTAAANAGKIMASLQQNIPEKHWLDGKVTLDDFGKSIVKFGEGIQKYSEKVSGINVELISSSLSAAKKLVSITKSIANLDSSGISEFKKVSGIGEGISNYSTKISSVNFEKVSSSITSIKALVKFINSLSGLKTGGISTFKEAINDLAQTNLNGIAEAFKGSISELASIGSDLSNALARGFKSNQSAVTSAATSVISAMHEILIGKSEVFTSVGRILMVRLVTGISSQKAQIARATTSGISSAVSDARDYYDSFYSAGSYLVSGFAGGIGDNTYKAEAKSKAMAEAAYEAAREALDINSPSKVFRRLAYCIPEGFAQGIDRMGKCVENSATNMAKTAIDGTENALSYIADVINGDIDIQPTIRPVLDLSDFQSGAGSISAMFNNSGTIGLRANVSAISSMMNQNRQNGSNDEVVSAINKLNKSLNNLEKPSYVINGVTYDDGSNVSNAVESLVRAARIERRI